MNDKNQVDPIIMEYQTNLLQQLISDVHNCCKDRIYLEARMFQLPAAELKCLTLFEGHKYLTGMEIAGLLEVAKSRATVIISGLEDKGLVQRATDPNDGRSKIVSLTPTGQKKVREIEDFTFHLHQQLLSKIEPVKRPGVIDALEILKNSMEKMKGQLTSESISQKG